jgi:hypothetical protein
MDTSLLVVLGILAAIGAEAIVVVVVSVLKLLKLERRVKEDNRFFQEALSHANDTIWRETSSVRNDMQAELNSLRREVEDLRSYTDSRLDKLGNKLIPDQAYKKTNLIKD